MSGKSRAASAWIDGAARGNPGPAGFGALLERGDEATSVVGFLGDTTNNVAEYAGLIAALSLAIRHRVEQLTIYSDSQLLVRQMSGQYRVKAAHLKPLFLRASRLRREIPRVEIRHVARDQNSHADGLANQAIDERAPIPEWLELRILGAGA